MRHDSSRMSRTASTRIRRPGSSRAIRLSFEALESRELLSADAVLDWNAIALQAVADDHSSAPPSEGGPVATARALGIVHAAIFDAVNSIDRSFQPYLTLKKHCKGASMDAAVAEAAHDTLAALYPGQQATFDAALAAVLDATPNGIAERQAIILGKSVAKRILQAHANDNAYAPMNYTAGTLPGQHRVDPLHPGQGFLDPRWGSVTPFAIARSSQFRAPAPPSLTSDEYTAAYNEVKTLGGDGVTTPTTRTAEQTEIGIFWGYDGSPGLGTPPRLYNQIARVIAAQQGNTEVQNARLFALINIAMADAGITSWETKYVFNFWRPIVAIRESDPGTGPSGLGDGNANTAGDPTWTPLGAPCSNGCGTVTNFTPPFPAYVSGHATFGAALFQTLTDFYGRDDIPFSFTSDEFNGVTTDQSGAVRPVMTRSWTRLSDASFENAQSRIYLGIHWAFDRDQGIAQGNHVADYVFSHILQPA